MLALTAFALTTNCLPPLVTTISSELSFPISRFGLLFTLQFGMFAFAAFGSTAVRRRVPVAHRTFVLVGLGALSLVLLASPLFRRPLSLVVFVGLLGLSGGLVESHSSMIVSDFDARKQSQFLNLSQAFFSLGGIIAPYTVALLFRLGLAWQAILMVLGGLIALMAALFAATPLDRAVAPAGVSVSGQQNTPSQGGDARDGDDPIEWDNPEGRGVSTHTASPLFGVVVLSAAMFLYTASEATIVSWLPSLLQVGRSMPRADAAALLGAFWFGELVTRGAMFYLPARRSVISIIYAALGLSLLGIVLLWLGAGGALVALVVWLCGLAFGPVWPSIVAVARMTEGSSELAIRVIGIGGLGAAVGPIASAPIIRGFGIEAVAPFVAVLILLELSTLLLYSLHRRGAASSSRRRFAGRNDREP